MTVADREIDLHPAPTCSVCGRTTREAIVTGGAVVCARCALTAGMTFEGVPSSPVDRGREASESRRGDGLKLSPETDTPSNTFPPVPCAGCGATLRTDPRTACPLCGWPDHEDQDPERNHVELLSMGLRWGSRDLARYETGESL